ncbi:MAG: hypothetical protein ACLRPW_02945 [Intestinibacter sp.]
MPYYLAENEYSQIMISQYEFEDLKIDIDNEINVLERRSKKIKLAEKQILAVKESVNSGVLV